MDIVKNYELKAFEKERYGCLTRKFDMLNRRLEKWRETHNQNKVKKLKKVNNLLMKATPSVLRL